MLLTTTIKNISRGPSSMVPMMERPASGVRYALKENSIKSLASAVKRMVKEAARTSLIVALLLRMRRPKRSRKYQATPISAATTRPTPTNTDQKSDCWIKSCDSSCEMSSCSMIPCEMIRSIGGREPTPIRTVSESQVIAMRATKSLTLGSPSIQARKRSKRVGAL
jgi:hypothetical protein